MSIVLNLSMPKNCWECKYSCMLNKDCPVMLGYANSGDFREARHPECPIQEIPTEHGRLVDCDDIRLEMIPLSFSCQQWISDVALSNNVKTILKSTKELQI